MIEEFGIVGYPLIETHAEYKAPMRQNDLIRIFSHCTSHTSKTFTINHKVYKNERLCVKGHEIRCWAVRDVEFKHQFQAMRLPSIFTEKLKIT